MAATAPHAVTAPASLAVTAVAHHHTSTHRFLSAGRMSSNDELLLVALLAKKKSKRRSLEKKMHVHNMLSSRMDRGLHHTLSNDLCADEKFFNFFRMSKTSFEELLSYIRRDITGTTTNMRECITPEEKFSVALR